MTQIFFNEAYLGVIGYITENTFVGKIIINIIKNIFLILITTYFTFFIFFEIYFFESIDQRIYNN